MHEQRDHAQQEERVHEHLAAHLLVALQLGFADAVGPALVRPADELVHDRHDGVQLHAMHRLVVGAQHLVHLRHDVGGHLAERQVAFEVLLRLVEAAAGQAVEHVGEQRALLEHRVGHARVGQLLGGGKERLGLEAHRLLVEAERQEVRAQLFDGVEFQQLVGRGRLHRARRRRLLVAEQDVVVRHERRLADGMLGGAGREDVARAQRLDERRLGNPVEVQVVLADELVHFGILRAPEIAPAAPRQAHLVVDGHGERHRRPQALGPAPHGEAFEAVDDRGLHAPFDVARDAERHERLARAEADARPPEHLARRIAVVDGGELDLEALLALLGLAQLVRRQLAGHGVVGFARVVLDVHDGRREEFLDGLRHDGAHLGIGLKRRHVAAQEVGERGQVEIPVLHGAHLGRRAGERRLRRDEVLGRIAVAQVALVGVGVLGLAALHGAAAHHLAAVEERARLSVVELQRGTALQMAVLVQLLDELLADQLVHVARVAHARPLVDGQADVVGIERGLLRLMVLLHVVGDGAVELPRLHELAIALVDGRAEAVGAADEAHVGRADAVAQEAREGVGRHEHPGDVAEVQRLVAVGHARRDDGALRPGGAFVAIARCCHRCPAPSVLGRYRRWKCRFRT